MLFFFGWLVQIEPKHIIRNFGTEDLVSRNKQHPIKIAPPPPPPLYNKFSTFKRLKEGLNPNIKQ